MLVDVTSEEIPDKLQTLSIRVYLIYSGLII